MTLIVPVGLEPPARTLEIELLAMAVPAVPLAGPAAVIVGLALLTTVSDIPEPQVLAAELLLPSPP